MTCANDPVRLYQDPVRLLTRLIRFDTTNPPGEVAACISYIADLLEQAGVETFVVAKDPERPNLVARLSGGDAAPLLLHGHVDVASTAGQEWRHPPFEGVVDGGYVWGRGALDMKGGVAMLLAAVLRAKAEGTPLPGDVILALVGDEETGGDRGAKYLIERHPELFEGVRYAIGEFGGFALNLRGRRFYPIQVAEKQICWLRATVRGQGGHGATPGRDGAMGRAGRLLDQLDRHRLPVHVTPVMREMLLTMSDALPRSVRGLVRRLLETRLTDLALSLPPSLGQVVDPLLRNTVSATIVRGGHNINVIPGEVVLELDGRLLPGQRPEHLLAELRRMVGKDIEFDLTRHDQGPATPDLRLFATLGDILREADPGSVPVPLLLAGATDARHFARLGIQTYGFLPMNLSPKDAHLLRNIHGADERIPIGAVAFGAQAVHEALRRFGVW